MQFPKSTHSFMPVTLLVSYMIVICRITIKYLKVTNYYIVYYIRLMVLKKDIKNINI